MCGVTPLARVERRIASRRLEQKSLQPVSCRRAAAVAHFLRRRGHVIQSARFAQQLLEDVAGGQGRSRDESGDHADHDGVNFIVRNVPVAEALQDRSVQPRGWPRRIEDGGIDHGSYPRCAGQSEPAGLGFAERVGEQQRRYRHRPFGERVGVIDRETEILDAGLCRHPGDEVFHDVEAALRRIDQRICDLPRPLNQPLRVWIFDQVADDVMLALLLDTFEAEDKRRGAAAELLHLRAIGDPEDVMLREHVAHVGVAGDDDQPAEPRDRPERPEESERDPQRPQPKPSENR